MVELANLAGDAQWTSMRLVTDNDGEDATRVDWGGGRGDEAGFINLWPNARSESGERSDYLVTRPRAGARGTVKGLFPAIAMPSQAEFRARVGFLEETPDSSGAVFELRVHYQHGGQPLSHRVFSLYKQRDGTLADVEVDLSFLSGREVRLELRVDVGPSPHGSDLPVWQAPQVVERETPLAVPTRFFQLRPIALTVNTRTERSGGGDDPFFGVVYFRSSVGVRGSTVVEVLDLLQNVGDNIDSGSTIPVGDDAAMVVADVGLQSGTDATLMGTIFVALEEDKFGRDVVRETLRTTADRIALFLTQTAENDPASVTGDPAGFANALQRAAAGADPNAPEEIPLPSVGEVLNTTLKRIGGWFGRAHDLIGVNGVTVVVGPLAPVVIALADSSTSRTYPVSELVDREYALDYEGDGGSWTLRIETQVVEPTRTVTGNPTLTQT